MQRIACSLWFVFWGVISLAQSHNIDSLRKRAAIMPADTGKVALLIKLGDFLRDAGNDSASIAYQDALALSSQLHDDTRIMLSLTRLGHYYDINDKFDLALHYYSLLHEKGQHTNNPDAIAVADQGLASVLYSLNNYSEAVRHYTAALKWYEQQGDEAKISDLLANLGNVHFLYGDYRNARSEYQRSLKICLSLADSGGVAYALQSLGAVFTKTGDFDSAESYCLRAIAIANSGRNIRKLANLNGQMSELYANSHQYTKSIYYAWQAIEWCKSLKTLTTKANSYFYLGYAYLCAGSDTLGQTEIIDNSTTELISGLPPDLFPKTKRAQLQQAILFFKKGAIVADSAHNIDIKKNCYEGLSMAYPLIGNADSAYSSLKAFYVLKDSMYSQEQQNKVINTNLQYAYDKQRFADSLQNLAVVQKQAEAYHRQRIFSLAGLAVAALLSGLSFFLFRSRKLLGLEKKRSDDLLLNILPADVADELKQTGVSQARQFAEVTVLFTDFVGFTKVSEHLTPAALVTELDTCFKAFDNIITRNGIEKIKTIGDAYLAVGGLPDPNPEHAFNTVRAALEIADFMKSRHNEMGENSFQVRIGINTGPVVAGIVGLRKFAYDIWGDTVNTAARMEQNSVPGRINISESTWQHVKDEFPCEYRGEIAAKNKGVLKMYFVGNPK